MSAFIPPRRARLKKRQSEVHGVSFAEQKMIEKALKQSLQDSNTTYTTCSSEDDETESSPSPERSRKSTIPQMTLLRSNVAKKSAINFRPSLSDSEQPTHSKRFKHGPALLNTKNEDPIYRPHIASVPVRGLPPKRTFERLSKTISYINISVTSSESDDSDSSSYVDNNNADSYEEDNSNRCPSPARSSSSSSKDVLVISDTTDTSSGFDSTTSSSEDDSRTTKYSAAKKGQNLLDCVSQYNIKKPLNPPTVLNTNVKTQKILFKAVKKSTLLAPKAAVVKPNKIIKTESINCVAMKQAKKNNKSNVKVNSKKKKSECNAKPVVTGSSTFAALPPSNDTAYNQLFDSETVDSEMSDWSLLSEESDNDFLLLPGKQSTPTRDGGSSYTAQRKFAAYLSPSNQSSSGICSPAINTEITCTTPSTEDFLLFLCLRNSGSMPESLNIFNSPWTNQTLKPPRSRPPRLNDVALRPLSLAKKMATNIT